MSLGTADLAGAPPMAGPAEIGPIARLRDRAALIVMIGGNVFSVLALVGISALISSISAYFATQAHDGIVVSVLGYRMGPEMAAQWMITLLGIGIMFGGPAVGLAAERLGYSRLLTIALAVYAVSGSAGLYLQDPVSLLASRLVLGLASASISICCFSLVGARFHGVARSRILGYQSALVMIAGLLGLFASGAIAKFGGWRAPFAIYLLAVPMCALALIASRPPIPAGTREKPPGIGVLRPMWPLYLVLIPFNLAAYMTSVHLPFVLVSDHVTEPLDQGLIMASSFLMNILTALFYGRVAARFSRRWIFVMLVGVFALSDIIIGLSGGWIGTMIGCWVAGLGGGLMSPFFVNIILNQAPEAARARAIGLMYTMMYVGDFANPVFITPLRQHVGNHQVFAIIGIVLAAGALAQALSRWTPLGAERRQPA
jgi:MFS family permease